MKELTVHAVVLAGGFGTRIQHLLPDRPKPMALVAGRPFLEWIVRFLKRDGLDRFVLSTGFRAEVVSHYFETCPVADVGVTCVRETTPLGTAGGFLHCTGSAAEIPNAWLVTNGDSLAIASVRGLLALLDDPQVEGAVLGVRMADAGRYGTLEVDGAGTLRRFVEKQPGAGIINAGVYVFRQSLLAGFPTQRPLSFETDVFPRLLREGTIKVLVTDAPFLDIGTPETLVQAEAFISNHLSHFSS